MLPKSFFSIPDNQGININLGECCVLMPFADEFDEVYKAIETATKGGEICFHCVRADMFLHGGSIMEDILGAIGHAEIIIADLTKKNPNVLYELGISHTIKESKKVIIISQDILDGDVPFDVRSLRIIRYDSTPNGLKELTKLIVQAILEVGEHSWQFEVSDGQTYRKALKIFGLDGNNYMFGLSEVGVGIGGADFYLDVHQTNSKTEVTQERLKLRENSELEIKGLGWDLKLLKADGRNARFSMGRHKMAK